MSSTNLGGPAASTTPTAASITPTAAPTSKQPITEKKTNSIFGSTVGSTVGSTAQSASPVCKISDLSNQDKTVCERTISDLSNTATKIEFAKAVFENPLNGGLIDWLQGASNSELNSDLGDEKIEVQDYDPELKSLSTDSLKKLNDFP